MGIIIILIIIIIIAVECHIVTGEQRDIGHIFFLTHMSSSTLHYIAKNFSLSYEDAINVSHIDTYRNSKSRKHVRALITYLYNGRFWLTYKETAGNLALPHFQRTVINGFIFSPHERFSRNLCWDYDLNIWQYNNTKS